MTGLGRKERYRSRHSHIFGDRRFRVSAEAHAALVADVPYRAYYLPLSTRLVNIEPL